LLCESKHGVYPIAGNFGFAFGDTSPMLDSLLNPQMRRIFPRKTTPTRALPKPLHGMWEAVARFSTHIQEGEFMKEMIRRRKAHGSRGTMGLRDCATLYGLVRWQRPSVVVESGGYLGISSAFILKALADEGLASAKVYSIEFNKDCSHGILIPNELRSGFVALSADVKDLVKDDQLPSSIDVFLHDSSHRYKHMLWEFREFWKRLRDGGMLISHDVHFSAAFPEFVARTYAHDKQGLLDAKRTTHYEWGRWGYIGFAIKKQG
jgi:predicted O-methyltransferase YrrM